MTTGRNKATIRIIGGVLFGLIIAALWIASMAHTAYAQQTTGFISNWLSGKCIDVQGSPGMENGARLQLWSCEYSGYGPGNSPTDQIWELTWDGYIVNSQSGKCIDVQGSPGTANGARLQLWSCEFSGRGPSNSPTDQRWELTWDGYLANRLSGKCIDVKGAPGTANGAVLQLWSCEYSGWGPGNSSTDQMWSLQW